MPGTTDRRPPRLTTAALAVTAALALAACATHSSAADPDDDKNVKILFATNADFAIPVITDKLEAKGYTVDASSITDFQAAAGAVANGEADYHVGTHTVYLLSQTEKTGADIVPAFYTALAPAGFYSTKVDSLAALPDGAVVGIPNEPSNVGRALTILAEAGVIELGPTVSSVYTSVKDISSNPKNLDFRELDATLIAKTLADLDIGFLYSSGAKNNGFTPGEDALALDDIATSRPYTIIAATRSELLDSQTTKDLEEAYHSEEYRQADLEFNGGIGFYPWEYDPTEDIATWKQAG
ncbi:MetQ/NlpA family ABC transporter substrate-binding protein [Oerskovia jenensis]|uniref:D-methionine transport system substrate-binding protein n=1 Tax=Oerskovia jenensis TaxID=162169 RepID=A0ABS2LEI9_9CELL|nr:MetQ/NlpA family ABC transporter substrate-binding protein [Oerskovia jenensis]MBM7478816.1 D-methionine transport system substrate-binding protein [Oerskovia jenensis]